MEPIYRGSAPYYHQPAPQRDRVRALSRELLALFNLFDTNRMSLDTFRARLGDMDLVESPEVTRLLHQRPLAFSTLYRALQGEPAVTAAAPPSPAASLPPPKPSLVEYFSREPPHPRGRAPTWTDPISVSSYLAAQKWKSLTPEERSSIGLDAFIRKITEERALEAREKELKGLFGGKRRRKTRRRNAKKSKKHVSRRRRGTRKH